MDHGFRNELLYTASRVEAAFLHSSGSRKTVLGTGFFVKNSHGFICFLTNRHVLDYGYRKKSEEGLGWQLAAVKVTVKNLDVQSKLPDSHTILSIVFENLRFHPTYDNDVAAVVGVKGRTLNDGRTNLDHVLAYDSIATADYIKSMDVCDFVAFPGFPEWHDHSQERPILRMGTVASDPRYDYANGHVRGQCVAFEAFSTGGASGSPVFSLQRGMKVAAPLENKGYREGKLVGINAGHLKGEFGSHSGISYFYKATTILDLIEGQTAPEASKES